MAESEVGAWTKASDLLIGKLPPTGSHEEEPDIEHRCNPNKHMDVRSSVLKSHYMQAKAVEQFSLPRDEEFLKKIPDVGLHVILRSYLTRGCLVEQEIYHRLAQGHHAYEKLRKKYEAQGVGDSDELDQVVKDLSTKQAELNDWRREMEVKEQLIAELKASDARKSAEIEELKRRLRGGNVEMGSVSEALRERDLAMTQVALEKQIAQHAKAQLEEELIAKRQLLEECSQLKESLCMAESKVGYLESGDYQSTIIEKCRRAIVEEFRQSAMGKIEVSLACKAGCDYIVAQLPAEYQEFPGRLQYPPSIANHIDLLSKLEDAGGGYDVKGGEDEEKPEDMVGMSADDSTGEAEKDDGEASTERKSDDVVHDVPSTPPSYVHISLPLTPGADMDLS